MDWIGFWGGKWPRHPGLLTYLRLFCPAPDRRSLIMRPREYRGIAMAKVELERSSPPLTVGKYRGGKVYLVALKAPSSV